MSTGPDGDDDSAWQKDSLSSGHIISW